MKILVNDKNIDFTLENEKRLGDVVQDLEKWLAHNDNVVRSVKVNHEYLNLEDFNSENNMRIEDIKTVEIETSNKIDLAFDTLKTINEYRLNILNILNNNTDEIIKRNDEVLEGIKLILEGLQLSLRILNINSYVIIKNKNERLGNMLARMAEIKNEYEKKYLDEKAIKIIENILNDMETYLIKIYKWGLVKNYRKIKNRTLKEIPFIDEILKDLLLVCKDTEKKFEEIGTNIQIGEDLKAFNEIYFLSGIIDEIIGVFQVIKEAAFESNVDILEKLETERVFESITDNLKEVEESFHNEDFVTIADIMEYELKPLFEELTSLINKINDFIKINQFYY